jgi:DNA polymerase III delta prime subunit
MSKPKKKTAQSARLDLKRDAHCAVCETMKSDANKIEKARTLLAELRMDIGTAHHETVRQYVGAIKRLILRGEIDAPKARDELEKIGCVYLG